MWFQKGVKPSLLNARSPLIDNTIAQSSGLLVKFACVVSLEDFRDQTPLVDSKRVKVVVVAVFLCFFV